ncbi:HAD-IC family P-type ATPase [bacterium]|nr:HAD-IC family P-type ATPase [bacterium]
MNSDKKNDLAVNWYQRDTPDVFSQLKTSLEGLSVSEVAARLKEYGPNKLAEEKKISKFKILLHQFNNPLIYVLLVAAVVTGLLKEYIDTSVIMAVVFLNAIIGYVQEYRAEESVRALKMMVVPKARVHRAGKDMEINSEQLVPGDIVLLAAGAKVPADLRLFKTKEIKIDEAMLTGESIASEKITVGIKEDNLISGDQKNMAFMGTIVVNGRAQGIVVETGGSSVLGQIAKEVQEVSAGKTPLQEKLEKFARIIVYIVLGFSSLVFVGGVIMGTKISEMFMTAVATAISAIPEGLPVAVTIAMAIGMTRMAKQNAIIRKLPAVETLGSTTIIGSDKTGTLTKNEMTVKLLYDGEHTYEFTGSGYAPEGEILHKQKPLPGEKANSLLQVLRIGLLCNEANVYEEAGDHKVNGDPTEGALITSALKGEFDFEKEKRSYPEIDAIPFESERGYMATLHSHGGKKIIFIKGAPEKVLSRCTECLEAGEFKKKNILQMADNFAQDGLRVLAMAYKEVPTETESISAHDIETDLIFSGLQGMIDPPRPETIAAVSKCRRAGIRVVMITGDYTVTAVTIAKNLGIGGQEPQVLSGQEIETLSDESLFQKVKEIDVYARVSPQHKLRITQQLLQQGEIMAVTGDGVNDAPALKAAHIGIAMGKTGTDVAKEASDMVLADDNFASIFSAVEKGRVVYDNIKKVTLFLISCGLGELIAISTTIFMGYPIPYIPAQILWLNLVTNGFQDIALAFEPGEKGVSERKPRDPKEGILSSLLVQRTILMGIIMAIGTVAIFLIKLDAGVPLERARTIALTTMVFFQFYQALNCRSENQSIFRMSLLSNPFLFYSIIAAFFAQMAVLYVPALQWVFRTVPLTLTEWVEIGASTTIIIIAVEIDKWIRRRLSAGKAAQSA